MHRGNHMPHLPHNNLSSSKQSQQQQRRSRAGRVRTVLTEKQLSLLKSCYSANPRPDALMKEQLVEMTGLSPRVVRVWFQNKRCKDKKKLAMKQGKVRVINLITALILSKVFQWYFQIMIISICCLMGIWQLFQIRYCDHGWKTKSLLTFCLFCFTKVH